MDAKQKINLISATILVVCLVIATAIYFHTGEIYIAIFFAPPIIHWILKKRARSEK